jgi:ribosome-associated translation inhibitor RaiA
MRLGKMPKMPETKHKVSLTIVFASTDIKSSDEEAARFAIELEKLLDKYKTKPKARIHSRKISVEGHTYSELKSKGDE